MQIEFKTFIDEDHKTLKPDFLSSMKERFNSVTNREDIGFFKLKDSERHIKECTNIYNKFSNKKYFIQIGIGGSALGPQMLIDAFGNQNNCRILFMDNTDAEYIQDVIDQIESPKDALFYVVSKSGGTAETVANFAIAKNFLLDNGVKENELNNYFVFCTDPKSGHLRKMANEENYETLEVPNDLGGRFSVFSPVGLLPALFAKINIEELIKGAQDYAQEVSTKGANHDLFTTGAHLAYLLKEENINQTILMPYSSKLKNLSHWFVQLWGESLGKYNEETKSHTGLTPIPAYGATDQHSQMQLFMEGPNDKVLFLLEVVEKKYNFSLNSKINMKPAEDLENYSLNQLIKAQFNGTLKALEQRKRNVVRISIQKNNEYAMGQLVMYFESLTALMGEYLGINAFNQPGVELGKKFAYEYLKSLA